MHFEILAEDQSSMALLNHLVPQIISEEHTFKIHPYKGVGRIPKGLKGTADPAKRILLDRLPKLLRGYGKTYSAGDKDYPVAVFVVCDLDDKCLREFRQELLQTLSNCAPSPETRFCIAVEETEAWCLGDPRAVKTAYPRAKEQVLNSYKNDSICGTWEKLADAVSSGGSQKLLKLGWQAIGEEKRKWAEAIGARMNVDENNSPSFRYFREEMRELAPGS